MNKPRTIATLAVAMVTSSAWADTIFVDDDGPNDPVPFDNTLSDPLEDGSADHPFDRIQEGINAAAFSGDEVVVLVGTYLEAIDLIGKQVTASGCCTIVTARTEARPRDGPWGCRRVATKQQVVEVLAAS